MIQVRSLSKSFGNFRALKDVSLGVNRGTVYALLGPNGSGKTTLLKSLVGSIPYDHGSVCLAGEADVQSMAYKRKFSYMPQFPGFLPHLSAKESIELLVHLRKQKAVYLGHLVSDLKIDLFWERPFGELSGGMKQKINILQCFMFDFEVALLDEPTSSLDPQIACYVKDLIRELKEKGKTVIFTSHIMSEVEDVADRMALISNGHILLEAVPREFVEEQGAKNLEQALLAYWSENES